MGRSSARAEQASLRQAHTHRRRNPLSAAASLQALESIESTSEASVDGCLVAKKSVESFGVGNGVLSNGSFPYVSPSPHTQFFEKTDCVCNRIHGKALRPLLRASLLEPFLHAQFLYPFLGSLVEVQPYLLNRRH